MKTFVHDFGDGIAATVTAPEKQPAIFAPEVVWSATPNPKHLRPFMKWTNSVLSTLVDEWRCTLVYQ